MSSADRRTSPIDWVDPFHGNGAVATPVPRGIAAAWNWEKAQVGNTHPGARVRPDRLLVSERPAR